MSAAPAILLLEDDPNLGVIVQESLQRQGYVVTLRTNGQEGLRALVDSAYALCLVDVMMPLMDGFAFARELRRRDADLPLIFLTARSMTEDRIEGFRAGCDDYVTKPFSMEELQLRIEAVLRRRTGVVSPTWRIGSYDFDSRHQLLRRGDEEIHLTSRETELLTLLCENLNRTLDRSEALLRVWGDDSYHKGRSMDVFVSRLRKHLQDDPAVEIKTIHGQGFRLMVD